jgi:peptidoglycan/LPS O-acetylase OafA/YrhL
VTEPATEVTDGRSRLPRMTSLRWYAALVVLLYHANATLDWRPLHVFAFGQVGVTFFFVLSGYVLAWSYSPATTPRRFWWRRFARIYPSHLVVLVVAVVLGLTVAGEDFITDPLGVLAAVLLLQAWVPTFDVLYAGNPPSWSLSCEAFFYALFPWLHGRIRRASTTTVVVATVAFLVVMAVAGRLIAPPGTDLGNTLGYANPVVRLPEFVVGIVLARLVKGGLRSPVPMWAAVVLVGVSVATWRVEPNVPYLFLPAIVLLLLSAVTLDPGRPGWAADVARVDLAWRGVLRALPRPPGRAAHARVHRRAAGRRRPGHHGHGQRGPGGGPAPRCRASSAAEIDSSGSHTRRCAGPDVGCGPWDS